MHTHTTLLIAVTALVAAGASEAQPPPQPPDWPRFHVGIAVATVRSDVNLTVSEAEGIPAQIGRDTTAEAGTGWKLVFGFRPLRLFGAEIQYLDFGDGSRTQSTGGQVPIQIVAMKGSATATVVSALLFIPERAQEADIYAKIGVANLEEKLEASGYTGLLPGCLPVCRFESSVESSDSVAYAGLGARFDLPRALGVRIELEGLDREDGGMLKQLSVGISGEF